MEYYLFISLILCCFVAILLLTVFDDIGNKKFNAPFERESKRVEYKLKKYKIGVRVVAINNNGIWSQGIIYGHSKWVLFSLYFIIKFDDGSIMEQAEQRVSTI